MTSTPLRLSGRVLAAAVFLLMCQVSCRRAAECEVLPRRPLDVLQLKRSEHPREYRLLHDQGLLAELQMTRNPDYVRKPSDLELVARAGGLTSFLALYGPDSNDVRLVINGVYFRDAQRFDAFVAMQREKSRQVLAYRRPTVDGLWLLLAARNPEHVYDAEESARLRKGLQRYASRLNLETVFDELENGNAP